MYGRKWRTFLVDKHTRDNLVDEKHHLHINSEKVLEDIIIVVEL